MTTVAPLLTEGPADLLAEPKIPTMDKKLIMTVATTGGFIRHEQNPDQPYYPKEISEHVIASYKAGAAIWHVHIRDKTGALAKEVGPILEAAEMVLEKCPDILMSQSGHWEIGKRGADGVKSLVEPLLNEGARRGKKYIDTVVVAPATVGRQQMDKEDVQDVVKYLLSMGIVPEFQNQDVRFLWNVQHWLIEPGIIKPPYVMNLLMGYHGPRFIGGTTPDPWGHLNLINMMEMLPRGSVIGATVGGRQWLPLTVQAILMGADCVRIGMEDAIWMYPHRDIKIRRCADTITKVATITKELGREIATPAEARKIMGCK
ncbi:MAG: 3-keto-5-aminohexanoate cleavage protein [Chloroflexi bacterium]|nr:3-keto-5-aminohexanoate cleavage protein [Chloroflexota bacterium]